MQVALVAQPPGGGYHPKQFPLETKSHILVGHQEVMQKPSVTGASNPILQSSSVSKAVDPRTQEVSLTERSPQSRGHQEVTQYPVFPRSSE
mmetsp:Transcript_18886/g.27863  ORF Transcript_18886/g.27863 Transcript_18886/m.27863 type:complete len:91 (+) Transcript_18886:224-496(+)